MIILAIKTDQPEAELWLYEDNRKLGHIKWQAHLKLAETIHSRINELLSGLQKSLDDIDGIVCFKGPGSFTGLRIGLSVANTLAYSQGIPVVGSKGENWLKAGIKSLRAGQNDKITTPLYGRPAATTPPRK